MVEQMTSYNKTNLSFCFLSTGVFAPPGSKRWHCVVSSDFDVYLNIKNMERCGCSFHVCSLCMTEMEPLLIWPNENSDQGPVPTGRLARSLLMRSRFRVTSD